jgi:hypothetical protein
VAGTTPLFSVDTTGALSLAGAIALANGQQVFGAAGGAQSYAGAPVYISLFNRNGADSSTTGGVSMVKVVESFTPPSGSASWAGLHINPTISGTSSGAAYGLLLASKTNTLTGGTVKLASFGTTTTDGFTGYSEKFAVDINGAVSVGNTVNSVSPTSPNRTITIMIGGATYYLAAKTTND